MSCQNHPNKESVANCQFCGKKLCEECAISIAGKNYCENCMSELIGPELANIAMKTPDIETQETDILNQSSPIGEQNHVAETQNPIHEESIDTEQNQTPTIENEDPQTPDTEQNQTPTIENEEPIAREKEQGISPQNSQNINNIDDTEHDDIYSDNRLYDDIYGDEPSPTPQSNEEVEKTYEKYLDDLYFDENPETLENADTVENKNLSLSEQLAEDESKNGPITQEPFVPEPQVATEDNFNENDKNKNIPIMENLRNTDSDPENEEKEGEYTTSSLHRGSIHYKNKEKVPYSSTEKILIVILILLIILVAMYIVYLLTLHSHYPSIIQAITAFFENPGEVLSKMIS